MGKRHTYEQKLDELRKIIARTIAPDKVSLFLEELAKTDWQTLMLSLQVQWRACDNCGKSYRIRLEHSTALFCAQCYTEELKREANKVSFQRFRANWAYCLATLTVKEWLETLNFFEWKCAYCRKAPYTDLEHFIPITLEGGTTKDNCIPTCHRCNMLKDNLHPDHVMLIPAEDIERVRAYLRYTTTGA